MSISNFFLVIDPLLGHLLVEPHQDVGSSDQLVREAAQGRTDVVRDLLQKFPDKVKFKFVLFFLSFHNYPKRSISFIFAGRFTM